MSGKQKFRYPFPAATYLGSREREHDPKKHLDLSHLSDFVLKRFLHSCFQKRTSPDGDVSVTTPPKDDKLTKHPVERTRGKTAVELLRVKLGMLEDRLAT